MTVGSLFDGSGTAPLAASLCGIEPVWASEIEPVPIKITSHHFPNMKHLGSIDAIKGDEITPVDIICGGSPCQDLSVSGRRAGLQEGQSSHLFFEMIRVIEEMRQATDRQYPKYVIWENVYGSFTSKKGEDFYAVLQEFTRIADPTANVPRPPKKKGGGLDWRNAGTIVGDGWSLAWRVFSAQYWGVPQQRRRVYLVLNLADERAAEILFEREGGTDNIEAGGDLREGTPRSIEGSFGRGGSVELNRGFVFDITSTHNNSMKSSNPHSCFKERTISKTLDRNVASPTCNQGGCVVVFANEEGSARKYTLRKYTPLECGRLQGFPDYWCENIILEEPTDEQLAFWKEVFETYRIIEGKGKKEKTEKQIRKWLKEPPSDTQLYEMWGNGMVLPNMRFIMERIR